jgi:hypothetical protein
MGRVNVGGPSLSLLICCAWVFKERCRPSKGCATHLRQAVKEWSRNPEEGSNVAGWGRAMEGGKACPSCNHKKAVRRRPMVHCASLKGSKCLRDRMVPPCRKFVDQVRGENTQDTSKPIGSADLEQAKGGEGVLVQNVRHEVQKVSVSVGIWL